MHPCGQIRIVQGEFPFASEQQIGQIVGGVPAVSRLPAYGDRFPVGIPLIEGAAGRGKVQVDKLGHAHPHTFEQFNGVIFGQGAGCKIRLVVRVQVLIHAPVTDDGPGFLLDAGEHLGEPLGLHGFIEVSCRVFRHMGARLRNTFQFPFANRIALF